MSDYLVDLRRLPPVVPVAGLAYGAYPVSRYLDLEFFVGKQFYTQWAQELRFAVARGTCRVLTNPGMETEIVGFACFDATFSGAFGPFGISQSPWQHGHGERKATCLWLSGVPPAHPIQHRRGPRGTCAPDGALADTVEG